MTRYSSSRSRSRSTHGGGDEEGFRVHVADLSVDCSQKELDRAFQKFGDTFEIWLARNPPCFAFVVYKHKDDAEEAIREMNGQVLAGSRIRCSWAKPRIKGGRGGVSSSSSSSRVPRDPNLRCFRCGDRGHFARDCTGSSSSRRSRRYSDDDDDRRRRRRSRSNSRHRRRSRSHSRSRSRSTRRKRSKSRSRSRDERRRRHRSSHSRSRSNSRHRTRRSRSRSRRRSRSPADRNAKKQNDAPAVKEKAEETVASNGNKSPARSESGMNNHEQEEEFDMNADDAGNKYDPTEQVDDEVDGEDQEAGENNGEENQEEN